MAWNIPTSFSTGSVDLLVNNAGGTFRAKELTVDGVERWSSPAWPDTLVMRPWCWWCESGCCCRRSSPSMSSLVSTIQAVAASRYGRRSAVIASIGDDTFVSMCVSLGAASEWTTGA